MARIKENVYMDKFHKAYSKMLELKLDIQAKEEKLIKKKEEWRKLGEQVRSEAQEVSQLKQKLFDNITNIT